jgi:hypothetical protein
MQVVDANSREIGHLIVREDFLARFNGNHGPWPLFLSACFSLHPLDA